MPAVVGRQSARFQALGFRLVAGRFPRPVRRIEMQAEREGLARLRVAVDDVDGAIAEQFGGVAHLLDGHVVVPEIGLVIGAFVPIVVDAAAAESVEVIVAALQRAEFRQFAEVPLADERRRIAGFLQQRRQRRMLGRQADHGVSSAERFLETEPQAVLIASGDERRARCGTDRGVGIALQKPNAFRGDPIDVRAFSDRAGHSS